MIRLIVDTYGGSHHNIFIIIDSNPRQVKIVDSYFLFDFFEISDIEFKKLALKEDEALKYIAIMLLNYWKDRIKSIENGRKRFVPFDLSDEYIGGFLLERVKNNFQVKLVWTDKILGQSIDKSRLDNRLKEEMIELSASVEGQWLISEEGLYNGIDWSIKELS